MWPRAMLLRTWLGVIGSFGHTRAISVTLGSLRHTRLDRVSYVLMQDFMLFCRSSFRLYYRDTCAEFCLRVTTGNIKVYEITRF